MAISARWKVILGAAAAVAAAITPFVHSFGPVFLERYLGNPPAPPAETPKPDPKENFATKKEVEEQARRDAEVQRDILRLLIEAKKSARLPAPEPNQAAGNPAAAQQPPPPAPDPPQSDAQPVTIAKAEPGKAPNPIKPDPVHAKPAATLGPELFGVFPGQEFSVCGFGQSTARIKSGASGQVVTFKSMDKGIPDRPFRGFEQDVPVDTVVELFKGCLVGFAYEELSGTERITVSYAIKGDG